jgi:hypothetical protein
MPSMTPASRLTRSCRLTTGLLALLFLVLTTTPGCGTAASVGATPPIGVSSEPASSALDINSSSSTTSGAPSDMVTPTAIAEDPGVATSEEANSLATTVLKSAVKRFPQLVDFEVLTAEKVESDSNPEISLVFRSTTNHGQRLAIVLQKNVPNDVVSSLTGAGYVQRQTSISGGVDAAARKRSSGTQLVVLLSDHTVVNLISDTSSSTDADSFLSIDELEGLAEIVVAQMKSVSF